jgi:hypothetical protein
MSADRSLVYAVCVNQLLRGCAPLTGALAFRRFSAGQATTLTSWLSSRPCFLACGLAGLTRPFMSQSRCRAVKAAVEPISNPRVGPALAFAVMIAIFPNSARSVIIDWLGTVEAAVGKKLRATRGDVCGFPGNGSVLRARPVPPQTATPLRSALNLPPQTHSSRPLAQEPHSIYKFGREWRARVAHIPQGNGHSTENEYQAIDLSQWITGVPPYLLADHFGKPADIFEKISSSAPYGAGSGRSVMPPLTLTPSSS